ncbi:UNVERIFIED_CONTAM: hypothetical protein LK11_38705 [Mumia flava]
MVGAAMAAAALVGVSPPPASAAPSENCVGDFECIDLVNGKGEVLLGDYPVDLVPVRSEPSRAGDQPWEGTFQLRLREESGETYCMSVDPVNFIRSCEANDITQAFAFEPVSGNAWTGTDVIDTESWSPWTSNAGSAYFHLRPAVGPESCVFLSTGILAIGVDCGDAPELKLRFEGLERAEVTARVIGSAMEFALDRCRGNTALCATQLRDRTNGTVLSDWDRIDQVTIDARPNPVVRAAGCASGGGPQSIYNGGTEPMSTTIGASATNEYSHSVSTSLSVENSFSFGKDSAFFKYELKVTATASYGRTWTESKTVEQDVQWTIPPRRFATATLSTAAIQGSGSWRFNLGSSHPWETRDVVDLAIPYAFSSAASAPDTTLAVQNSWGQKACDADPSAVLGDGKQVSVTNTTAPTGGPIPGDVLTANADPSWWEEPRSAGTPAPGVNLIYQWYRQRGSEAPTAIPGATKKNYTVTGDDITDDEILEWVGPYHLYVGVTDVATANRFDSLESFAVATDATRTERRPVSTGPKPTTLRITVENPGAAATEDTEIAVEATTDSASTIPTGTVTIYDVNGPLTDATLGADGTGRAWVRLAPGMHELAGTYLGDGSAGAAVSTRVRTTVRRAETETTLQLPGRVRALAPTTARVTVEGEGGTPTGNVRLYDGGTPLGAAVPLDGDGTARIDLSGFDEVGARDLSASYAGSSLYATSTSEGRTIEVTEVPTSTTLGVDGAASAGGALRLTARVAAGAAPTPTGAVQFTDRGRPLGEPVALRNGSASLRIDDLVAGARHVLRASYEPDAPYGASISRERDVSVASSATSLRLSSSNVVIARGDRVALRAKARTGGSEPAGTVRFYADGRALGARTVDGDGVAVLRTATLPTGKLRLSARFTPSAGSGLASATAPTVVQDVRRYRSAVKAVVADTGLKRRERLVVTGSVAIAGRPGAALTARRVWLLVDGERVASGRLGRDRTYVLRLAAKKLSKGRHLVRVAYVGSPRPSVAPGASRVTVVRRR